MTGVRERTSIAVRRFLRGHPTMWRAVRSVRSRVGSALPARVVPGVDARFHRNDTMIRTYGRRLTADSARRYLAAGAETADVIAAHLEKATGRDLRADGTWLEIGCGFGRILRSLAHDVEPARMWAVDVDREAVEFCVAELGVRGGVATTAFGGLAGIEADAVYAISVATHVDETGFRRFVAMLGKVVAPGGAVLFTTMGPYSLENLQWYDHGAYVPERERIEKEFAARGMAYVPYSYVPGGSYGIAWHDPAFVRATVSEMHGDRFAEVVHQPRGIENHQDLWVFRRAG